MPKPAQPKPAQPKTKTTEEKTLRALRRVVEWVNATRGTPSDATSEQVLAQAASDLEVETK